MPNLSEIRQRFCTDFSILTDRYEQELENLHTRTMNPDDRAEIALELRELATIEKWVRKRCPDMPYVL